jgi:hypothetical protein
MPCLVEIDEHVDGRFQVVGEERQVAGYQTSCKATDGAATTCSSIREAIWLEVALLIAVSMSLDTIYCESV